MEPTMNSVKIKMTGLFILFFIFAASHLALAEKQVIGENKLGTVSGRIVLPDGSPFPVGFVAFFSSEDEEPQDYGGTLRSPKMIAFVQDEGRFSTRPFPAGSYYLGAMDRQKWGVGGPPRPGETRYSAIDEKGEYVIITLQGGQDLDIGTVTVRKPQKFPERSDSFTITGKIIDDKGEGVGGALVMVKKDYNEPKAVFISKKTAADGSYQIKLPPGRYFLIARESMTLAGRPKPGSVMGVLGQTKPIGIGGQSDQPPAYILGASGEEYKDVNIIMFEVPVPEVKRKEIESQVKSQKIDKESLPDHLPLKKVAPEKTVQAPVQAEEKGSESKK